MSNDRALALGCRVVGILVCGLFARMPTEQSSGATVAQELGSTGFYTAMLCNRPAIDTLIDALQGAQSLGRV